MVCIVNGNTAGGAELFANALRKMADVSLVGSTTAGQGVVLSEPQSLSDGSAIVITVGLILDNEDQSWNGTGLTPDVEVTLSADEMNNYYDFTVDTDPQIQRCRRSRAGAGRLSLLHFMNRRAGRSHAWHVDFVRQAIRKENPMPALTDLSTIRSLCDRYGFSLSKGFGQNFIINPGVCPRIAESCRHWPRLGVCWKSAPGIGVLTEQLAKRAARVGVGGN